MLAASFNVMKIVQVVILYFFAFWSIRPLLLLGLPSPLSVFAGGVVVILSPEPVVIGGSHCVLSLSASEAGGAWIRAEQSAHGLGLG